MLYYKLCMQTCDCPRRYLRPKGSTGVSTREELFSGRELPDGEPANFKGSKTPTQSSKGGWVVEICCLKDPGIILRDSAPLRSVPAGGPPWKGRFAFCGFRGGIWSQEGRSNHRRQDCNSIQPMHVLWDWLQGRSNRSGHSRMATKQRS